MVEASARRSAQQRAADGPPPETTARSKRGGRPLRRVWQGILHDRSVRVRVTALLFVPLLAAALLASALVYNTVNDALAAQRSATVMRISQEAMLFAKSVQTERDQTAQVGGDVEDSLVTSARATTDDSGQSLLSEIEGVDLNSLPTSAQNAITRLEDRVGDIEAIRERVTQERNPFDPQGAQDYRNSVRAVFEVIEQAAIIDPRLAGDVEGSLSLLEASELASSERALVAWVLSQDRQATEDELQTLEVYQEGQDQLIDRALDQLPEEHQATLIEGLNIVRPQIQSARLSFAEGTLQQQDSFNWWTVATDRLSVLQGPAESLMADIVDDAEAAALRSRTIAYATIAGLIVVLLITTILTLAISRSIVRPLRRLQAAALRTAQRDLPQVVDQVREKGPKAVEEARSGIVAEGNDEIGRVAQAFNEVYATAVRVAGEQALLRQNLDSIVVNLSRRTQSLVDRQLREIEQLEDSERDPEQLSTLFRIDHLATRVQRHAESLLVLAGVESANRNPEPVSILDVIRAAAGEVEQYDRVRFGMLPTEPVAAHAVDDVAHLVAELLDNATEFSPPATTVLVDSERLLGGSVRITVADQGLGVPAARLAELNERLVSPGDIDVAASRTLGLYVVSRLARKHGISVRLEAPSSGGTVAIVDVPASLMASHLDIAGGQPPESAPAAASADGGTPAWNVAQQAGWTPSSQGSAAGDLPRRGAAEHRADLPVTRPASVPQRPAADHRPAGRPEPLRERRQYERPSNDQRGGAGGNLPRRGAGPDQVVRPGDTQPPVNPYAQPERPTSQPERNASQPEAVPAAATPVSAGGPATNPHVELSDAPHDLESPIFNALHSSWFRRHSDEAPVEWSSPADAGWRTADAVTRRNESTGALPANGRAPSPAPQPRAVPPVSAPASTPSAPATPSLPHRPAPPREPAPMLRRDDLRLRRDDFGRPANDRPANDGSFDDRPFDDRSFDDRSLLGDARPAQPARHPEPEPAPEPVDAPPELTEAGLPMRQRGASLIPGAIAATRDTDNGRDATVVRSTLTNLIGGVSRARVDDSHESYPDRDDNERSDS